MKNKKNFLIIIIILILLGSFGLFEYKKGIERKTRMKKESIVFNFNKDDIIKIDLENDKGQVIFEKDEKGLWYMAYPEKFLADKNTIKNILTHFSSVCKKDTLGDDADLHKFELDKNYIDLKFYLKNGENESLHIGDTTPSGDCNYAKKENGREVMLICSSYIDLISKPPIEYKNRYLWEGEQDEVKNNIQKVVIKNKNAEMVIEKAADDKWAAKSGGAASASACKAFVDYLKTAESSNFIRGHGKHKRVCGINEPRYKIEIYCKDRPKPLELVVGNFNKMRGSVWVKYADSKQIAGLDHEFLNLLEDLYK